VPYVSFLLYAHWPLSDEKLALHYAEDLIYTLRVSKDILGFGRLSLKRVSAIAGVPGAQQSIEKSRSKMAASSRDADERKQRPDNTKLLP
jgi:hypothetical protein